MIDFKAIVASRLQEAAFELAPYFAKFMRKGDGGADGKYKKGRKKSTSSKLGILTGNLSRALVPKRDGNINAITTIDGATVWEFGIDLNVIKYARIHEYGGPVRNFIMPARPYLDPGVAAWFKANGSKLLENIFNDVRKAFDAEVPV